MNRLLSLCGYFFLQIITAFSGGHVRERRKENFYFLISELAGFKYRLIDWVTPFRRRQLSRRKRTIEHLAHLYETVSEDRVCGGTSQLLSGEQDFSKIKVAIFIPSFLRGQGGAEKVAGQVATILTEAGAKIEIFCRNALADSPPHYDVPNNVCLNTLDERDDAVIALHRSRDFDLLIGFGMAHFFRRIAHISELLGCPFVIQEGTHPLAMEKNLRRLTDSHTQEDAYWHGETIQPIHVVIAANKAHRAGSSGESSAAEAVRADEGARAEVGARRRGA